MVKLVLAELQSAHDALRLRYVREGDDWRQFHVDALDGIPVTEVDIEPLSGAEREQFIDGAASELQRGLNISTGPIGRGMLFQCGDSEPSQLLLAIHHLVVDGVSWRILRQDFENVYGQLRRGEAARLPPKTTPFKIWSERLAEYAQTVELRQSTKFWLEQSAHGAARLPVDYYDPAEKDLPATSRLVAISLPREETRLLLHEVPKAYRTQINDVLLTALAQAFTSWTGQQALLIDMEGHGREPVFDDVDLSRTVGWFTSVYPVLIDLGGTKGVGEALRSVKEQLRRIPARGLGYGVLRYLCDDSDIAAQLRALPRHS